MNKEDLKILEKQLKSFENQITYIEMMGAVSYFIKIRKAKILISREMIVISDGSQKNFVLDLFHYDNLKIQNKSVIIEFDNDLKFRINT